MFTAKIYFLFQLHFSLTYYKQTQFQKELAAALTSVRYSFCQCTTYSYLLEKQDSSQTGWNPLAYTNATTHKSVIVNILFVKFRSSYTTVVVMTLYWWVG